MNFIGLEKSFSEFNLENVIKVNNPSEFFEIQSKCNKSYYEILPNIVKPFFDIENVENEDIVIKLIEHIKESVKKCFSYDISQYILTKNEHSSNHSGLSYHLIIQDCKIEMSILRRFVKNELKDFNIVDDMIYTKNRLFRTIDSYGLTKTNEKDMNSVHHLYKCVCNCSDEESLKNASLISFIEHIENELIINRNIEKIWNLNEVTKKQTRRHQIVLKTWSQNTLNLSNLEIVDGNVLVPLSVRISDKLNTEKIIERLLYDKIIVLLDFNICDISKNKLLEMKSYYADKKTFKDYKFTLNQIRYMINLIESETKQ